MLARIKKKLLRNEFLKSLAVLMTGTLIAQIIGYLLAPVITRLYTPAEMGEFGMFQRVTVLIATIATARYEHALPLPKKDNHAFFLFRFALKITGITLILTMLIGIAYGAVKQKGFDYFFLIAFLLVCILGLVFFNLGTNWSIRKKYFKKISMAKMTQSITLNGLRVAFGSFQLGSAGLILAYGISFITSALYFMKDFTIQNGLVQRKLANIKTTIISRRYKDFPIANLPLALSDYVRDVLVALILIEFFSESLFGAFDHSYRMLRIPVMLIGASLSHVFFSRISSYKSEGKLIFPLFRNVIRTLSLLSIIPFVVIYFFGAPIFEFVFGDLWRLSGELSEIMAPWLMLNFIVSPLSTIPLVFGKQKSFLAIGIFSSSLQIMGFLLIPYILGNSDINIILMFHSVTWAQVLMALLTIYYLYTIVKRHDANIMKGNIE
tara:strand:+ start:7844 stop:9151 length:1308 start_codon:yes stop_codon:yes gene_type:complete